MDLVVGEGMVTGVDMQLTEREEETESKRERERLNSKKER